MGTLCFFPNKPFRGSTRLCDGVGFTPFQVSKHLPPRKTHFLVGKQGADCTVVHLLACVSPPHFSEPSPNLPGQIECMTEMRKRETGICPPCTCLALGVRNVYPSLPGPGKGESPPREGCVRVLHPPSSSGEAVCPIHPLESPQGAGLLLSLPHPSKLWCSLAPVL